MTFKFSKSILLLIIILSALRTYSQECGVERWRIKTLSDPDTAFINFARPVPTSVHAQANLFRPFKKFTSRHFTERIFYSMECIVLGYVKEKDQDIHIVVKDKNTSETMVIEIAGPECFDVRFTSRYDQLKNVYNTFIARFGKPSHRFRSLINPVTVKITGVGFWDFLHHQRGMAPNGREIHPVLSMSF